MIERNPPWLDAAQIMLCGVGALVGLTWLIGQILQNPALTHFFHGVFEYSCPRCWKRRSEQNSRRYAREAMQRKAARG